MKQSYNPARAARRRAEALEQLGTQQPCCIYCGIVDPLLVRPRRIVGHHLFSEKRDSTEAPVCLNCHAVAHEGLQDAEVLMKCEREPTKFAGVIFRALAVHFSLLAKACWRFARRMQ